MLLTTTFNSFKDIIPLTKDTYMLNFLRDLKKVKDRSRRAKGLFVCKENTTIHFYGCTSDNLTYSFPHTFNRYDLYLFMRKAFDGTSEFSLSKDMNDLYYKDIKIDSFEFVDNKLIIESKVKLPLFKSLHEKFEYLNNYNFAINVDEKDKVVAYVTFNKEKYILEDDKLLFKKVFKSKYNESVCMEDITNLKCENRCDGDHKSNLDNYILSNINILKSLNNDDYKTISSLENTINSIIINSDLFDYKLNLTMYYTNYSVLAQTHIDCKTLCNFINNILIFKDEDKLTPSPDNKRLYWKNNEVSLVSTTEDGIKFVLIDRVKKLGEYTLSSLKDDNDLYKYLKSMSIDVILTDSGVYGSMERVDCVCDKLIKYEIMGDSLVATIKLNVQDLYKNMGYNIYPNLF